MSDELVRRAMDVVGPMFEGDSQTMREYLRMLGQKEYRTGIDSMTPEEHSHWLKLTEMYNFPRTVGPYVTLEDEHSDRLRYLNEGRGRLSDDYLDRSYAEGGDVEGLPEGAQPRSFEDAQRLLDEQNAKRVAREELSRLQTPEWQNAQSRKAFGQSFSPERLNSMAQPSGSQLPAGIPNFTTPQQQNAQMNDAIAMAREIEARNRRQEAGQALVQTWPVQMAKDAYGAVTAPGDALYGRLNPQSDEAIKRAFDLAGVTASGTLAQRAPAGAVLGSGPVRQAVETPRELSPLGLYSHGYEAARTMQQAKGTPDQFYSYLTSSNVGVKPVEMEGFREAFAGKPTVTREEVAQFFQDRMPKLEETVLGADAKPPITETRYRELADAWENRQLTQDEMREFNSYERYVNGERLPSDASYMPTIYGEYTIPGGNNYREVLLRSPSTNTAPPLTPSELREFENLRSIGTGQMTKDEIVRYYELLGIDANYRRGREQANDYRSAHWNEPNVVAHMRMSDRTGPQGEKILHLEELQSDWAQEGRKSGFVNTEAVRQWKDKENEILGELGAIKREQLRFHNEKPKFVPGEMSPREYENILDKYYLSLDLNPEYKALQRQVVETTRRLREHEAIQPRNGSVRPGPHYVNSTEAWTNLGLKRALKEAADSGYEQLVWTPGAEQAKRYDLSKQLKEVSYSPEDGRMYGRTKNGEKFEQDVSVDQLPQYVGKDVAEKLMAQPVQTNKYWGTPRHVLSGVELSVGGEGMIGYYDKIVPTQLAKLVKKLDPSVKIGKSVVNGVEVHSIPITPKMREAIGKGFSAYAEGGSVVNHALMLTSKHMP